MAPSLLRRIKRALRVTSLREDAGPANERIRSATLGVLVAIAYLVIGSVRSGAALTEQFGVSPFEFDYALRMISAGWFSPERTFPITLVDIDEQVQRDWGSPIVTPRDELARLLNVVTAASPATVFVDIDLSWGSNASDRPGHEGDLALQKFLQSYRGPAPILLPKRVETLPDEGPRAASSPFDATVAASPHLHWTHAAFETDAGGKVREWREWLAACTDAGLEWLPAVPLALGAVLPERVADLPRSEPPAPASPRCDSTATTRGVTTHRLLLGPRLTGPGRHQLKPDAAVVPATMLLDEAIARDDAALFTGRAVFIGASYQSSGDLWLTPSGVYPGVELLASMVRFAPLLSEPSSRISQFAHRAIAVALFATFAFLWWRLRGLVATAFATLVALAYLAIAVGWFDDLTAFEVLEAAILMMILYTGLGAVLDFAADFKSARSGADRRHGWRGALAAVCLRHHEPANGDERERTPH
jgi:CHASE2 domain-containing sensor protein